MWAQEKVPTRREGERHQGGSAGGVALLSPADKGGVSGVFSGRCSSDDNGLYEQSSSY